MRIILFVLLLANALPAMSRDYEPDEIVNPNIANRYEYVADPEGRLGEETRQAVNSRLHSLRNSTSAEVAVAVVPSIGDYTIEDFSEKVFTRWGIGKKDKDNGVLLLISPDSRQVRIQTGYGTEGILPDITCGHIISTAVIPNMRNGCLDCAVDDATKMIAEIMEDPTYAEELKSRLKDNYSGLDEAPVSKETVVSFLGIVALILWIVAAWSYISDRRKTKKMTSTVEKAQKWRSTLTLFGFLAIGTLLTALPFYLLALYHYKRARYGSHKCDNCGGKTHMLKGQEAIGALTPSQQFEEKIGSVHYDVHRCDKCGKTDVVPFPTRNTPYSYCPHCGTRAYHYIGSRTLRHPT
ncbi:MAG: TPM domain-containing protein [Muribaculaceae bacterium]|nr:TPM domain-containing protein [Muribaculaceae bacterium]